MITNILSSIFLLWNEREEKKVAPKKKKKKEKEGKKRNSDRLRTTQGFHPRFSNGVFIFSFLLLF